MGTFPTYKTASITVLSYFSWLLFIPPPVIGYPWYGRWAPLTQFITGYIRTPLLSAPLFTSSATSLERVKPLVLYFTFASAINALNNDARPALASVIKDQLNESLKCSASCTCTYRFSLWFAYWYSLRANFIILLARSAWVSPLFCVILIRALAKICTVRNSSIMGGYLFKTLYCRHLWCRPNIHRYILMRFPHRNIRPS